MKNNALNINSSVEWLNAGKILAHPTESIWGLGCDARNEEAVKLIFKIKKRDKKKNFILLVKSLESFEKYLEEINTEDKTFLDKILTEGYEKADKAASKKIKKIHEIVGF